MFFAILVLLYSLNKALYKTEILWLKKLGKKEHTKTNKQLFITMITSFGVHKNEYAVGLVDQQVLLEDLFVNFSKEG